MSKLIKHRGLHNEFIKENTYEAILSALQNDQYLGVEFDVRETLDNIFILYHNPLYNNKLISKTLYKELPRYIPKLDSILKINSDKIFLIEVKNINNYQKLYNLLNKYSNKKLYVMSFSNNIINKLNIANRKYKIGILNYVLNTDDLINKLDFVAILNSLLNDNIMNSLKTKEVFSYGIKEKMKYANVYYITDN